MRAQDVIGGAGELGRENGHSTVRARPARSAIRPSTGVATVLRASGWPTGAGAFGGGDAAVTREQRRERHSQKNSELIRPQQRVASPTTLSSVHRSASARAIEQTPARDCAGRLNPSRVARGDSARLCGRLCDREDAWPGEARVTTRNRNLLATAALSMRGPRRHALWAAGRDEPRGRQPGGKVIRSPGMSGRVANRRRSGCPAPRRDASGHPARRRHACTGCGPTRPVPHPALPSGCGQ